MLSFKNEPRWGTTRQRPTSGKALASFLLALLSMALAWANSHPVLETGVTLTLLFSLFSLALAALTILDIWLGRAGNWNLLPALAGVGLVLLAMITALVLRVFQRAEERDQKVANSIGALTLVLHDYSQERGKFPPAAIVDKGGQPLLSWRVLVLPYLEKEGWAEPGLFERFKLDEPWDSPSNFPLLGRMPQVYAPPEGIQTPEPHSTYYRVFVGQGTAFEGSEGVPRTDFPDGVSQTTVVVEAAEATPWTKPGDLPYGRNQPLPRLGFHSEYCFFAGFADGSLHTIRKKASDRSIRALITRNGGDTPGPNWEFRGRGGEDRQDY